MAKVAFALE
jgi:hypothetical protein